MSTPSPNDYARFFMMFPDNAPMNRESEPILFTLPSDKTFPTDLVGIMNKTKRFLSFEQSEVKGSTTPQCDGTNCQCQNCPVSELVCVGKECIGQRATDPTTNITCNQTGCLASNDITYSMFPLYPVDMCLSQYNPKFKFMKYMSSEKIDGKAHESTIQKLFKEGETIPPMDILQLPNLVLFQVTYPISVFSTQDKFSELYEIITYTNNFITLFNEEKLIQHNIAMLQKVIAKNKLQKMDVKKLKQGVKISDEKNVSKKIIQTSIKDKEKKQLVFDTSPPLIEKYTEGKEIEVKTLRVPMSSRDDNLLLPDGLLVLEDDDLPKKRQQFPIWAIMLITIVVFFGLVVFFMSRRSNTKTITTKKPSRS